MTAFALRMTKFTNAVSKKHGEVARQMWASIWPDKKQEEIPITAVTNGVHLLTWLDPIWLQPLLDRYLGPDWTRDQDRAGIWELVRKIPDVRFVAAAKALKGSADRRNQRARPRALAEQTRPRRKRNRLRRAA